MPPHPHIYWQLIWFGDFFNIICCFSTTPVVTRNDSGPHHNHNSQMYTRNNVKEQKVSTSHCFKVISQACRIQLKGQKQTNDLKGLEDLINNECSWKNVDIGCDRYDCVLTASFSQSNMSWILLLKTETGQSIYRKALMKIFLQQSIKVASHNPSKNSHKCFNSTHFFSPFGDAQSQVKTKHCKALITIYINSQLDPIILLL